MKKNITKWINAEKERPKSKQDIIFIDTVGMYRGTYHAIKNGQVKFGTDTVDWDNVYVWIPYPKGDF